MSEYREIMRVVNEYAHPDSERKYGTSEDEDMPEDAIRVTIIATGLKESLHQAAAPVAWWRHQAGRGQQGFGAQAAYPQSVAGGGRSALGVYCGGLRCASAAASAFDDRSSYPHIDSVTRSGRNARSMNLSASDFSNQSVLDDLEIPAIAEKKTAES